MDIDGVEQATRDSRYYFLDGNVTIRVETTLFKVHKSVLSNDQSVFGTMFDSSPEIGHTNEGCSDENPVILHGDTPDEFRALLWALYALPAELAIVPSSSLDTLRYANLAQVSHKYHFFTTENWALRSLITDYKRPEVQLVCDDLTKVTEVAYLCNSKKLCQIMISKWRILLGTGKEIAAAINIAEKLNLQELRGLGYYTMMKEGRERWESDPRLNREQRIRLLSGHYYLTRECETLPLNPPPFQHHPSCPSSDQCWDGWQRSWDRIIRNPGPPPMPQQYSDLLGKVILALSIVEAFAQGKIPFDAFLDTISISCLPNLIQSIKDKMKDVVNDLNKWFVDVS